MVDFSTFPVVLIEVRAGRSCSAPILWPGRATDQLMLDGSGALVGIICNTINTEVGTNNASHLAMYGESK
jgi:hypothetical protein